LYREVFWELENEEMGILVVSFVERPFIVRILFSDP
jgi:hypothetical protein